MSFIRTVLGDIPPGSLGRCYAHEHLLIERSYVTQVFPEIHLPSAENAVLELTDVRKAGGGAVVETMPCDAGRNVVKLAEVSRQSGVHVIAPTGLHVPRFYPEGHWRFRLGVEPLTDLFVGEIDDGIDANDCAGPTVSRTTHRAGVLKLGSATLGLDDAPRTAFAAGAPGPPPPRRPAATPLGALQGVDWCSTACGALGGGGGPPDPPLQSFFADTPARAFAFRQ